jgi:hypothetical protein
MGIINLTENFKIKLFGDYIFYGVKVYFFPSGSLCLSRCKKMCSWPDDIEYIHKYSTGDYTAVPMMYRIQYTLRMIQLYSVSSVCHIYYIP